MSHFVFRGGRVLADQCVQDNCAIHVEDGVIADFHGGNEAEIVDLDGGWLVPGFVDTQVNGGGGVLFNDQPTVAGIAAIGAAHAKYGTTAFLPTLISDRLDVVAAGLDAVDAAIGRGCPASSASMSRDRFSTPRARGSMMPAISARSTTARSSC
ncbi:hypothetical protein [Sphingomonas hankookensis]|uniref:hypothetical protein n=1 Tax=Sphingomonas hankookensis TaxID=563996 RepID=UPI003D302607